MKKIFIDRFHCLNNYGTGMMGLITLYEIQKRIKKPLEFYCGCNGFSSFEEINAELPQKLRLKNHQSKDFVTSKWKWGRSLQKRQYIVDGSDVENYDAAIILGGDDLSEYYTHKIYRDLLKYWRWSKTTRLFLIGQSIGPFKKWRNRLVIKYFYKNIPIFVRDVWTKSYLDKEFGLNKNVYQGADIAFLDLPLQDNKDIEKEILEHYGLTKKKYVSIVISGLQGKYYTTDKAKYFEAYRQLISKIKKNPKLKEYKIVLLAHTFPPHGNEAKIIEEFLQTLNPSEKADIVPVTEKILQTRARFILGNGKLTVTGRMHAAISTFQMGTPAIALSYSAKYRGVIGENLHRNDLIIESDDEELWNTGKIVPLIEKKIDYILEHYQELTKEIKQRVEIQKEMVNNNFDKIAKMI